MFVYTVTKHNHTKVTSTVPCTVDEDYLVQNILINYSNSIRICIDAKIYISRDQRHYSNILQSGIQVTNK